MIELIELDRNFSTTRNVKIERPVREKKTAVKPDPGLLLSEEREQQNEGLSLNEILSKFKIRKWNKADGKN